MPTIRLAHDKVNLTYATDVHLAALPPGRRRGTYRQDILAKIAWWGDLTAQAQGAALCGGDFFHVKNAKSPSNSLGVINDAIHALGGFPQGQVWGVVGNHDVTGDNLNTLPDQPLGILMSAGVYQPVGCNDEDPLIFESQSGTRVRVDTYDWMPGEDLLATLQSVQDPHDAWEQAQLHYDEFPWHYRVAVVHSFQQAGRSGLMFNKDFALGHDDLQGTPFDVVCYGHDHSRKGITDYDKGPTHVQLGSLSRAALNSDETDRDVAIAVLTFMKGDEVKVREFKVPVAPLEVAFHTADLAVDKVASREDVKQFFAALEQNAREVKDVDPLEILMTLTQDPAIIETIKHYCEMF